MAGTSRTIGIVTPPEAFAALKSQPGAQLVDVRTKAEWTFVGAPDLAGIGKPVTLLEWRTYPAMAPNAAFVDSLVGSLDDGVDALYFLCRSGARSLEAGQAAQAYFDATGRKVACFNVSEGFEGDADAQGHRGTRNGWKAHGLPWRQA